MTNAATAQAVEIGKERLREFVANNETARSALAINGRDPDSISLNTLDSRGRRKETVDEDEDDDI